LAVGGRAADGPTCRANAAGTRGPIPCRPGGPGRNRPPRPAGPRTGPEKKLRFGQ